MARMRFVKISQPEMEAVRKFYEGVISYASHGLFFHEGLSLGVDIADIASRGEDYYETGRRILIERGWVEDISLGGDEVKVVGSIEASPGGKTETCHRLRGIVSKLYERERGVRVRFNEAKCVSAGASECIFKLEG